MTDNSFFENVKAQYFYDVASGLEIQQFYVNRFLMSMRDMFAAETNIAENVFSKWII